MKKKCCEDKNKGSSGGMGDGLTLLFAQSEAHLGEKDSRAVGGQLA